MRSPIGLDDLVRAVHHRFQDGPPNGWLLGWDEMRHFALIRAAAAPHQVSNQTSFDYGFCNWFDIRIDSDDDERYWTLTIKLSFITPTYCLFWTRYENPTQGAVIPNAPNGYQGVEDSVRTAVQNE